VNIDVEDEPSTHQPAELAAADAQNDEEARELNKEEM